MRGPFKTFFGLNSGFLCVGPYEPSNIYKGGSFNCEKGLKDEDSDKVKELGLKSEMGHFSPLCRTWFQQTKKTFKDAKKDKAGTRGIMTDLYSQAEVDKLGLTTCVPILGKKDAFEGALCADIKPQNDLSRFYGDESKGSKYMIFTPNNTEKEDWKKHWRTNNLVPHVNELILDGNYTKNDFQFKITDDKAMLFDQKNITWGNMWIRRNETAKDYGYIFIVTDMTIKFPNL